MNSKSFLLLAAITMMIFSAGCIFSPDEGDDIVGPPPPPPLAYPGTRDILMENFQLIYEDMDFDAFREMLHPDYFMILQASTIEQFPTVGPTIDLSEELTMHRRMFSGDSLFDPDTNLPIPGISNISFDEFRQLGEWVTSPPNDPIPNAESGTWQVEFLFDRSGFKAFSVKGQIKFYATFRDSLHEGLVQPYWQMIGQKDETIDQ
jgi:hypothetical protein